MARPLCTRRTGRILWVRSHAGTFGRAVTVDRRALFTKLLCLVLPYPANRTKHRKVYIPSYINLLLLNKRLFYVIRMFIYGLSLTKNTILRSILRNIGVVRVLYNPRRTILTNEYFRVYGILIG